jgi:hypothetical protein
MDMKDMRECKNCIAYQLHHNLLESMVCDSCGKKTMVWKQGKSGTFYAECTNCFSLIAVDLNTPCEEDSLFWQESKIIVEPQNKTIKKEVVLGLSKLLKLSAVKMSRDLKEGFEIAVSMKNIIEIMRFLEKNEIKYRTDMLDNPIEKYPYFKECKYPYSAMRIYLKGKQ